MKRLTRRKEDGTAYVQLYSDPDRPADIVFEKVRKEVEVIERLAHYEDLEEQGRLVELPCKLGDTAWHICGGEIEKDIVTGIEYRQNDFDLFVDEDIWAGTLGDLAFLTREEAEAKLEEKGGGSDERFD